MRDFTTKVYGKRERRNGRNFHTNDDFVTFKQLRRRRGRRRGRRRRVGTEIYFFPFTR